MNLSICAKLAQNYLTLIELLLALLGILLLALGYTYFQYLGLKSNVNELHAKVTSENRLRQQISVSINREQKLNEIANEFNQVIEKLKEAGTEKELLERLKQENQKLLNSVAKFESDLTEISFFAKIGEKLTSALNVESIAKMLFEYINSLTNLEAIELIYELNDKWQGLVLKNDGSIEILKNINLDQYELYLWSKHNNTNALLLDAAENYKSYVNHYPKTLSNSKPKAVLSISLSLDNKVMGILGVISIEANKMTKYQVEFIQSISSYLVVALENSRIHELVEVEKHKADNLLLNILPVNVANDLKEQGNYKPREYGNASILFTDFMGFTKMSSSMSPADLVDELNHIFKAFDRICIEYGLEKIKTIGDAYMAAIGINDNIEVLAKSGCENACNMIMAALRMQAFVEDRFNARSNQGLPAFRMRCGINTGTVVAGIVGETKFQYDIWGDAVNTASRMESSGEVARVNVSAFSYELTKEDSRFVFERRDEIEVKGKGKMKTYFVDINNDLLLMNMQHQAKGFEQLKAHVIAFLKANLSQKLKYHGLEHTIDVLKSVERYIVEENINNLKDQELLKIAALFHDSGFTKSYVDHEENSISIVKEIMPNFGYSTDDINVVTRLIRATKVPQNPQNQLEMILCDCDLDYLGRDDFNKTSKLLFEEWKNMDMINDIDTFNKRQIKFLESHSYFTDFAKNNRSIKKEQHLNKLKNNVG
jgi:class 3 adenylate cyclase/predicted metal-dependent HD superfamily phosphohydrolase